MNNHEFEKIFKGFKKILKPYSSALILRIDERDSYYLDTHHVMPNKKHLFFASAKIGKRYVAYHLMPVYVNPSLLDGCSDNLMGRMQGKSCFNLVHYESEIISELKELTQTGYKDYQARRYIDT